MDFLTPMTALFAAAAAVPALVALYFLKLRRTTMPVSSTLLWKRAVRDLQVNAPFQRIRHNLLLLLQLLALLAALAALSRPVLRTAGGPPRRYVLLIDRSASMNATDAAPSRLEQAKDRARQVIDQLRSRTAFSLQDASDQAMVVAFDDRAKVLCNFTSDKAQLRAAVDSVTPGDGPSALSEAYTIAQAYAAPPGEAANNRSSELPAQLDLFSDGRIADAETIATTAQQLRFHRVGSSGRNLAVARMEARRNFEKADEMEVFATIANFADEPMTCDVQLSLDGNIQSVRSVQTPPRRSAVGKDPGGPGTASLAFELTHDRGGVLEVRLAGSALKDDLAADNAAWAILPPPKALRVLLVTSGNGPLETALKACPLAGLEVVTPEIFDGMDHAAMSVQPTHDVIVLDRHAAAKLPRGRFLVFGRPPPAAGVPAEGALKNQIVVDWRSRHPILQYVNLSNLFAAQCLRMSLPPDATVLAEFGEAPAIALVRKQASVFLLLPFDVLETNWPFEPSFVMFCYNAVSFLGLEADARQQRHLKVNQAVTWEGLTPGADVKVHRPDGGETAITADPSGAARYPGTARVGVYRLRLTGREDEAFAVNLLDVAESDIRPADSLAVSGAEIAGQTSVRRENLELWPILTAAALVLACLEWLVYNLRVRIPGGTRSGKRGI